MSVTVRAVAAVTTRSLRTRGTGTRRPSASMWAATRRGCTIRPPFAIVMYASSTCIGVTDTPMPTGFVNMSDSVHWEAGARMPGDWPGNGIEVVTPYPNACMKYDRSFLPSVSATMCVPTFEDWARMSVAVIVDGWGWSSASGFVKPGIGIDEPTPVKTWSAVTLPRSTAPANAIILLTEPGS